jgi:hypothetical protein
MAKNSITDYSKTAASNTDIQSVDIDEGCLPSGINNAIRELMTDLAEMNDGTVTLTSPAAGSINITGNITVGGTVDGRDVATDGSKLDGVEASADVTDTANVTAAGAAMLTGATFTGSITAPDATFNGTTAVKLPAGTDAQRPTGVNGMLRYNSDDAQFEGYADGAWGAIAGGGETSFLLYSYTATSGQTTFSGSDDNSATLSYTASNIIVTLNGITLENGTDYTASNGTSIVLTVGASAGDELNVVAFKSFTVSDTVAASTGGTFNGNVAVNGDLTVDTNTLYVDSANNNVGIGTTSPLGKLEVKAAGFVASHISSDSTSETQLRFNTNTAARVSNQANTALLFDTNATERMRIDNSGNVLVGTTDTTLYNNSGSGNGGIALSMPAAGAGRIDAARAGTSYTANRLASDGSFFEFFKDGSEVGSIGSYVNYMYIGSSTTGLRFRGGNFDIVPFDPDDLQNRDNQIDLGDGAIRFDDIFATNGTIQTSDQNEKQQIASLTDAEITAAKAISKLFKTFKWNDKVEAKGDAARTHTGVIAQDVQQAMTDAGLDAGDYAFFISTTWWETQTEVPAVEAVEAQDAVYDDDGNLVTEAVEAVEAKDAYTRTDTYETAEEAPEGATERTRLGIRYPELLAFVGAATEQRLADIETRLTALEAN